jgi:hypothetical protein
LLKVYTQSTDPMQYDNPETKWTWKPAQQRWGRRAQVIVGALVIMAASCVTAGFVIGRMTAGTRVGDVTALMRPVGSGDLPSAALAAPSGAPLKKQPEQDTTVAPGGAPSLVILNPGTADGGKQEQPDSAPNTRVRDSSKLRSDVQSPDPRDNRSPAVTDRVSGNSRHDAGASTERDYRALRGYMLNR